MSFPKGRNFDNLNEKEINSSPSDSEDDPVIPHVLSRNHQLTTPDTPRRRHSSLQSPLVLQLDGLPLRRPLSPRTKLDRSSPRSSQKHTPQRTRHQQHTIRRHHCGRSAFLPFSALSSINTDTDSTSWLRRRYSGSWLAACWVSVRCIRLLVWY